MINYKEHRFNKEIDAKKKQHEIKKRLGYLPSIFKVTPKGSKISHFTVVEPLNNGRNIGDKSFRWGF